MPFAGREGEGGLWAALAPEKAAGLGGLAGEAARILGCGDAGMGAAEAVLGTGLPRLGGSVLEQLLAAGRGPRGPRVPCGRGQQAVFVSCRGKVIGTVPGPVTLDTGLVSLRPVRARPRTARRQARRGGRVPVAGPGRDERPRRRGRV